MTRPKEGDRVRRVGTSGPTGIVEHINRATAALRADVYWGCDANGDGNRPPRRFTSVELLDNLERP